MFADRTSCHLWWPHQFRLLLASLAYVLMEGLRAIGLVGTELARAQVGTIRTRLLKVGAVIERNTRRVRFFLASANGVKYSGQRGRLSRQLRPSDLLMADLV